MEGKSKLLKADGRCFEAEFKNGMAIPNTMV